MIEETIPTGSTITYQGIDYTTEAEVNVLKIQAVDTVASEPVSTVDNATASSSNTPSADPIVAPEAPQPSTEQVEITPGETIEITEATQ